MKVPWPVLAIPMEPRVTSQPAVILHRKDWRNTSLILDLMTRDFGRVDLIAKSAKKSRDQFRYQPFVLLTVDWVGRGELKTLTFIEGHDLAIDPQNYLVLMYINELIRNFVPRYETETQVFDAYLAVLDRANDVVDESTLREFELGLMRSLGYFPDTSEEAFNGLPIVATGHYQFQVEAGFVACDQTAPNSVRGDMIIAWNRKHYQIPSVRRLAKSALRSTIDFNLHGKPLKSRDVYLQMKRRI